MTTKRSGLLIAAFAVSAVGAAGAADVTPAAGPTQAAPVQEQQSLKAVRDKATGKLRAPTEDELESMHQADRAQRSARGEREATGPTAPVSVRRHASGMVSAVLGPDYLVTIKGERGPDGKVTKSHTHPAHEHPAAPQQRPTE